MNAQSSLQARELLRQFERSYVNFHKYFKSLPPGSLPRPQLLTPNERPLSEADLPLSLRAHLEHYRRSRPDERITLVKYMKTVNGGLQLVVEDEAGLPPSDRLLCLSQTLTLYNEEVADVVTEVFVARRDPL